ncbi:RNA-binding S4 domain-containing protein [Paucilactobacillus sp. N302-9]
MRLDKFLKVSRIIKRRSVAKEISDQGRIMVNDRVAKSSSNVSVGDQLIIKFGNKTETIEILNIFETTKKDEAQQMYRIVDEQYEQDFRHK